MTRTETLRDGAPRILALLLFAGACGAPEPAPEPSAPVVEAPQTPDADPVASPEPFEPEPFEPEPPAATEPREFVPGPVAAPDSGEPAEPEPAGAEATTPRTSPATSTGNRRAWRVTQSSPVVGFDGESTLHEFTGKAYRVSGRFEVDLERPDLGITGRVETHSGDLDTGDTSRDEDMHELLEVDAHPLLSFEATKLEAAPLVATVPRSERPTGTSPRPTGTLTGTLHGRMTIRGVTRDFTARVRVQVDEEFGLDVRGDGPLLLTDFGIEPPRNFGILKMADEVRVWFEFRAVPDDAPAEPR